MALWHYVEQLLPCIEWTSLLRAGTNKRAEAWFDFGGKMQAPEEDRVGHASSDGCSGNPVISFVVDGNSHGMHVQQLMDSTSAAGRAHCMGRSSTWNPA